MAQRKESLYMISALNELGLIVYCSIANEETVNFVSNKDEGTIFKSKMLAYGWWWKAKSMFRVYRFVTVITL